MKITKRMDQLNSFFQSTCAKINHDLHIGFSQATSEAGYTAEQFRVHSTVSSQDENLLIVGGLR